MYKTAAVLIGLIAALHFYIAWFEMFAWVTKGPNVFSSLPPELFEPTKAMAANQGLYNSFLATGLVWSLLISDTRWRLNVATCFLLFVAAAGVFGALTVSQHIIVVQTVPALFALGFVFMSYRKLS